MRKLLSLLAFLALSCGGGGNDPVSSQCQNFFGSGPARMDLTVSGNLNSTNPSCAISMTWTNLPASQNGCTFTGGNSSSPAISGTFQDDGRVSVAVYGSPFSDCPLGLSGINAVISGATISGTMDSLGQCSSCVSKPGQAHVSFTIHKL